jgi:23S rRNA (uracil1939-C5)-methyltransferase
VRLTIERMAYGPDAIAHDGDGRAVFVSGAVAGDVVEAEVVEDKGSYLRARVTKVLEPSPSRVDAACPYASVCGGCPWASLSREAQMAAKRDAVTDALVRIGHMDAEAAEVLVAPAVRPGPDWGYRNKVELAAVRGHGRLSLGMHAAGAAGGSAPGAGVVKVRDCLLLGSRARGVVHSVSGALAYLLGTRDDIDLQRVAIRSSTRTGSLEVGMWTSPSPFPRAQAAKTLGKATPLTSLVRIVQKGPAKARRVVKVERLDGDGSWEEQVCDVRMRFSAPSFFQVNTKGAEQLVELVLAALEPTKDDLCWDLYSGAGTFTLPLAQRAGWVYAVESASSSVRDLRRNLASAGISNVEAIGGDAALESPEEEPDLVVVDPPRAGLAPDVVDMLSGCGARRIAYVSCDPATLARDLARFGERDAYQVASIQPVDQFAQSFHVEAVAVLKR